MKDLPFLAPLDAAALRAAGLPAEWTFGMRDQVRYSEIDALNHANNTAYLRWFEAIRVHYIQARGITTYDLGAPQTVVKRVTADYHAPMFLDEPYIVAARTLSFRRTSFVMRYAVFAPEIRAEGEAIVVMMEPDGRTKRPLDDAVRARLAELDGAEDAG
ncbi:MAG: thioesterase family protein [Pseudomonadota bacterium]